MSARDRLRPSDRLGGPHLDPSAGEDLVNDTGEGDTALLVVLADGDTQRVRRQWLAGGRGEAFRRRRARLWIDSRVRSVPGMRVPGSGSYTVSVTRSSAGSPPAVAKVTVSPTRATLLGGMLDATRANGTFQVRAGA